VAVAGEYLDLASGLVHLDAIPVELDLVQPIGACRHGFGQDRAAGLDEADEVTGGTMWATPVYGSGERGEPYIGECHDI